MSNSHTPQRAAESKKESPDADPKRLQTPEQNFLHFLQEVKTTGAAASPQKEPSPATARVASQLLGAFASPPPPPPSLQQTLEQAAPPPPASSSSSSSAAMMAVASASAASSSSSSSSGKRKRSASKKDSKKKGGCCCRKSQCLKLYCECLAVDGMCGPLCLCLNCKNNEAHKKLRDAAVHSIRLRNPNAFYRAKTVAAANAAESATTDTAAAAEAVPMRGCNCRRSRCVQRYCDCYSTNRKCTYLCTCLDCQNLREDGNTRKPAKKQKTTSAKAPKGGAVLPTYALAASVTAPVAAMVPMNAIVSPLSSSSSSSSAAAAAAAAGGGINGVRRMPKRRTSTLAASTMLASDEWRNPFLPRTSSTAVEAAAVMARAAASSGSDGGGAGGENGDAVDGVRAVPPKIDPSKPSIISRHSSWLAPSEPKRAPAAALALPRSHAMEGEEEEEELEEEEEEEKEKEKEEGSKKKKKKKKRKLDSVTTHPLVKEAFWYASKVLNRGARAAEEEEEKEGIASREKKENEQ